MCPSLLCDECPCAQNICKFLHVLYDKCPCSAFLAMLENLGKMAWAPCWREKWRITRWPELMPRCGINPSRAREDQVEEGAKRRGARGSHSLVVLVAWPCHAMESLEDAMAWHARPGSGDALAGLIQRRDRSTTARRLGGSDGVDPSPPFHSIHPATTMRSGKSRSDHSNFFSYVSRGNHEKRQ
eukprot:Gb_25342 [translate_table: standard]